MAALTKRSGATPDSGARPNTKLEMEIIGVVENSLYEGPREGVRRQAFVADSQSRFPASAAFYVRTSVPSATMFGNLRQTIKGLEASMPVFEMKTLENQLDETLTTERLIAALSTAFGRLATLLAAIGLYGVMAFVVASRTKEIGLRMALGAQQAAVAWLVMREVLILVAIGLVVGVPSAYFLSKYVSSSVIQCACRRCVDSAGSHIDSDSHRGCGGILSGAPGHGGGPDQDLALRVEDGGGS